MKKVTILVFVATGFILGIRSKSALAQAPLKISYQAVVRNGNNELVTDTPVGMRVTLLQGSATGTIVYQETHQPTTNSNGLVTVEIGGGVATTGIFSGIDWASGPYFIKTESDISGGTNYSITGTQQLLSVPYALYAASSGNSSASTNLSVTSANGFAGTVLNPTTAPTIELSTPVVGIIKGNGIGMSAATATDFPILNQNTTGRAATVTTNANLTGPVTSIGNATAIGNDVITPAMLSTVNANVGTFNKVTVNAKGLITAASNTTYEMPLIFFTGLTRTVNTIFNNLSIGKAGSQSVIGGTAASETLTLSSTSNATKGKILFGTSAYSEFNNRLGIGTQTPSTTLDVSGTLRVADGTQGAGKVLTSDATGNATWQTPSSGGEVPLTFSNGLTRTSNTITNNLTTGKAGSQSVIGGTAASETLTLSSTSNATKGKILFGTSAYSESNNRLGLGTQTPLTTLDVSGTLRVADGTQGVGKILTSDASGNATWQTPSSGGEVPLTFSNGLTRTSNTITNNLTTGKAGSQSVIGGTAASETITLSSTSNATKGKILFGTSAYSEFNNRLGVGTQTPSTTLDVSGTLRVADGTQGAGKILTSDASGNATWQALDVIVDAAHENTFLGSNAGALTTTGGGNAAVGYQALYSNTTGMGNAVLGDEALYSNTTGWYNVAIGIRSLYHNIGGDNNVAIGGDALYSNTFGTKNTAIGVAALATNDQGNYNTATGYGALRLNTMGNWNSAYGSDALSNNTTGVYNVANGKDALLNNTTGGYNTAVGISAMFENTSGTFNTAIGYASGPILSNLTNTTAIGQYAAPNASNTIVLGNTDVVGWGFGTQPGSAAIRVGSNATNGNGATLSLGGTWTNASDRNKKENFSSVNGAEILSMIKQLHVSRWNYKGENPTVTHIGPMAQDFYKLFRAGNDSTSISTIDPAGVALIGIQELAKENEELHKTVDKLLLLIDKMKTDENTIKAQISSLQSDYEIRLKKLEEMMSVSAKKNNE